MTTVELPPHLATVPEPDACVAARAAGGPAGMARTLRATAVSTSDVVTTTRANGVPGDWEGVSADTAGYAMAAFGSTADAVVAAFETAVRGLDVYDHQISQAARTWDRLDGDRHTLNADIDDLRSRIDEAGASGEAVDQATIASFQGEADRLARRRERLVDDFEGLARDVTAAEDRLSGVLTSVDTAAEGEDAAEDPGRPDVDSMLDRLRGIADDPEAVKDWWDSLGPAAREALVIAAPQLVGRTNGVPTRGRDDANRSMLEQDLEYLRGLEDLGVELTDEQERTLEHAEATESALRGDETVSDRITAEPVVPYLMLYDPGAFGGDGAGAVSYGDPDTADNTVVMVPGLTSDLSSIDTVGEDALRVLEQANRSGESTAVIGWIGYDAPSAAGVDGLVDGVLEGADYGSVALEAKAEAGGHALVDLVDGLRATDEGDQSHLTVIGHSYGSTTVAHAGADGLDEDSMVLLGSPGVGGGAGDATDLGVPPGHLYVGAADNDPITWLGGDDPVGLGPDPSQAGFGGTRIGVDPGEEFGPSDVLSVGFQGNHGSYYDENSESLGNIGNIVAGEQPQTTEPGRDQAARDYLRDWVGDQTVGQVREHVVDPVHDAVEGAVDGAFDTGRDIAGDTVDSLVSFGTHGPF